MTKPGETPPMPKPSEAPPGKSGEGPGPGGPGGGQSNPAPVLLLLVSDASRFKAGTPELKYEWGAIDTGIMSQNISLFCAATSIGTRPRASVAQDTQHAFLNHPAGYLK